MTAFQPGAAKLLRGLSNEAERRRTVEIGPSIGEWLAQMRAAPAMRALWLPGSVNENGDIFDQTHQGHTLTRGGNPLLDIYNDSLPFYDLDGTGDIFSRPDEAGFDILGTESYIVSGYRGLTMGFIGKVDSFANTHHICGKFSNAAGNRSYRLAVGNAGNLRGTITNNGTTEFNADVTVSAGVWFFGAMRFKPSTHVQTWVNAETTINTTSIPASIFNGNAAFTIGSVTGLGQDMAGGIGACWLAAAAWPDALIRYYLDRSRALWGF